MEQKYLPIGSVCTLKGKSKKVMVTGYYSVEFKGNLTIKDYCGCVYPEGMLLPESICNFNHNDIENIDFLGYKNEDQMVFKGLLNRLTGNIPEEEKAKQFHEENDMFLTSNNSYSKLLFDENGVVMIAEPMKKETDTNSTLSNIKFDENGTVISVGSPDVNNPFHKEYNNSEVNTVNSSNSIFKNIKFDENGTVISINKDFNEKEEKGLNKIKFDENGVVISDNSSTGFDDTKYEFDENGVVISAGKVEEQPINKYKFDENGVVVGNETEEEIPAIGQGLPGSENTPVETYKFDENGVVVGNEVEEEIPAIGPGLPESDEQPSKKYKFDENGILVLDE